MEEFSCALEHSSPTGVDMTQFSDTLPSVSITGDNVNEDFFLKEHHDKIEKLRKENFDLKMKLYLYESNLNLAENDGWQYNKIKK